MYKLGSSKDPGQIRIMLDILPILGKDRCSIGNVLKIINSLDDSVTKLKLLGDLWFIENRVYPYLLKVIKQLIKIN